MEITFFLLLLKFWASSIWFLKLWQFFYSFFIIFHQKFPDENGWNPKRKREKVLCNRQHSSQTFSLKLFQAAIHKKNLILSGEKLFSLDFPMIFMNRNCARKQKLKPFNDTWAFWKLFCDKQERHLKSRKTWKA